MHIKKLIGGVAFLFLFSISFGFSSYASVGETDLTGDAGHPAIEACEDFAYSECPTSRCNKHCNRDYWWDGGLFISSSECKPDFYACLTPQEEPPVGADGHPEYELCEAFAYSECPERCERICNRDCSVDSAGNKQCNDDYCIAENACFTDPSNPHPGGVDEQTTTTEPATTDSSPTDPTTTDSSTTEPTTDPATTEPPAAHTTADPTTTDSSTTEPTTTDSSAAVPTTTEPTTTESQTTEPLAEARTAPDLSTATDPTRIGKYHPASATISTTTINTDRTIVKAPAETVVNCESGSLIKGPSSSAIYYCGDDGKRHVFPNQRTYLSWYTDYNTVIEVSASELGQIPLGKLITYRPGVRMIKIQSDPKTYTVSRGGYLRWVTTEEVAVALYGTDWNTMIDDVDPAFFFGYTIGDPITIDDVGQSTQ